MKDKGNIVYFSLDQYGIYNNKNNNSFLSFEKTLGQVYYTI